MSEQSRLEPKESCSERQPWRLTGTYTVHKAPESRGEEKNPLLTKLIDLQHKTNCGLRLSSSASWSVSGTHARESQLLGSLGGPDARARLLHWPPAWASQPETHAFWGLSWPSHPPGCAKSLGVKQTLQPEELHTPRLGGPASPSSGNEARLT